MWFFVLIAFIVTGGVTLWGIRQFTRLRHTPLFVLFPLFLATYIPCSIVVLVPIDLMSASENSHPLFFLNEKARYVIWRVIYWLAFALTWAILPVLQSYVESGYHEPHRKFFDSLRKNARYQVTLLGAGALGLVYMIITSGLSPTSLKALVIAMSHCYALILAIWMLGHGLVNLPRTMWKEANPSAVLKNRYKHASKVADTFAESQTQYAEVAAEVTDLAPYKDGQYLEWIDELLDDIENGPVIRYHGTSRVTVDRSMITEEYLATLSSRLYRAIARATRYEADWQKLIKDCSVAEDILNSRGNHESLVFRYSRTRLPPKMAYWYYTTVHTHLVRTISVVLAVVSAALVWSEIFHGSVLSAVGFVISHSYGMWQQLLSMAILGYMCMCAFTALTRTRIFNLYALVHRYSDTSSMIFYAMYACRLTVPLSYNYLILVPSRDSVFEEFLGKSINLAPLWKNFNDWLPRLIVIPVLFTVFHFYDKIKDFLGFGLTFDDEEESEEDENGFSGSVTEGRELVKRALSDPRSQYAIIDLTPHLTRNFMPPRSSQGIPGNSSPFSNNNRSPASMSRYGLGSRPLSPESDVQPPSSSGNSIKSFFGSLNSKLQVGLENIRDRTNQQWLRLDNNNSNNSNDHNDIV